MGTIRGGVREFARERGGSDALLIDLALAVTEAVTNSVVHAFIDREPGIVRTRIQAAPNELVVVVTDNGRGMQPRADSPGLGLGLPTIASLTTAMDMHAPPGGGTVVTMTFAAPGVKGPPRRAAARGGALGRGRPDRRGHVAGGGRRAARRPARPRVRRRLRARRPRRRGRPAALRRPDRRAGRRRPVRLAGLAAPAHRRAAVRRPPGDGRRRPARRRAHPRAHRPDHQRRRGRPAHGRDRHPLVDRRPAGRGRPPARAAALRPAPRPRRAGRVTAGPSARGGRPRGPRAGHDAADLRPAPHPPPLRAHPRGDGGGRDRPGRLRSHGLRQRGGGAARRLRDGGGAAGHAGGRARGALRHVRRRREDRSTSTTCPRRGCSRAATRRRSSPAPSIAKAAASSGC